ncbi:MAG TPA: hypothetical protein VFZ11_11195 [Gemmatimonadaceae bacterium]
MSLADLLIAAAGGAVLFALAVALRPRRSCHGDCGACAGGCSTDGGKS